MQNRTFVMLHDGDGDRRLWVYDPNPCQVSELLSFFSGLDDKDNISGSYPKLSIILPQV